jgi:hypothetical protein
MTGLAPQAVAIDFKTAETETFRLYSHGQWDSLILVGKEALHENIDYFYLRFRMGVAYYNTNRYYTAIQHLEKARKFNSTDETTLQYLSLSYTAVGDAGSARAVYSGKGSHAYADAPVSSGVLADAHIEGGAVISSDNTLADKPNMMGSDSIYGEKDLYRNSYYGSFGLNFNLSKRFGLNFAYNYLDFLKVKYIQYTRIEDQLVTIADSSWGKNYIYSFPKVKYDTSFTYNTYQHEFYLSLPVTLPERFRITPAFHGIYVKTTNIKTSYSYQEVQDTGYFVKYDSSWYTFPFTRVNYSYTLKDSSFFNYLGSLSLSYDFSVFGLNLSGSYSDLNGKTQKQASLTLSYYPFGNSRFFGSTGVTGFFQKGGNRFIFTQTLGGEPVRNLWIKASLVYGDLTNASLNNGFLVYNNTDKINYMAGGSISWFFTKHLGIYAIYQFASKESTTWYYSAGESPQSRPVLKSEKNNYSTNSIFGGLIWKLN